MRIETIGIDLDNYTDAETFSKFVEKVKHRCQVFGTIIHARKTRGGYHLKVQLDKPCGFWRSIEIRYYCKDDLRRMFYDIMRYRSGGRMIDTLFDRKKRLKRSRSRDHGNGKGKGRGRQAGKGIKAGKGARARKDFKAKS